VRGGFDCATLHHCKTDVDMLASNAQDRSRALLEVLAAEAVTAAR
jgi:hypothetical protein